MGTTAGVIADRTILEDALIGVDQRIKDLETRRMGLRRQLRLHNGGPARLMGEAGTTEGEAGGGEQPKQRPMKASTRRKLKLAAEARWAAAKKAAGTAGKKR